MKILKSPAQVTRLIIPFLDIQKVEPVFLHVPYVAAWTPSIIGKWRTNPTCAYFVFSEYDTSSVLHLTPNYTSVKVSKFHCIGIERNRFSNMSAKRLQMSIDVAKIQKFFYSPKGIRISFIFQTKRKLKKDTLLDDTLILD